MAFNSVVLAAMTGSCAALDVNQTEPNNSVHSNLLIATDCVLAGALRLGCMTDAPVSTVSHDAFAGFATLLSVGGDSCPYEELNTLHDAKAAIESCVPGTSPHCDEYGTARADDSFVLRETCDPAEMNCVVVPGCGTGSDACPKALFEAWTQADHGATELFDGGGWKLEPGEPCILKTGGDDSSPDGLEDYFGTPRAPAQRSIGAHEFANKVCP
jgi:hypothetical protein